MKIVIVGPGAIGCLFGAHLARAGENVIFLDKDIARAEHIRKTGVIIEGISGNFSIRKVNITTEPMSIGKADAILIATKSYNTEEAIRISRPLVNKESAILTLQNGLGNFEIISRYAPGSQIICAVTAEGATLLANGHIRHAGKGETFIGVIPKPSSDLQNKKLEEIAGILKHAGFKTEISGNITSLIWSKLIVNVGINALTAITGLNNGRLLEFKGTKKIMYDAVTEAVKVARKTGIKLSCKKHLEKTSNVCRATYGNVSSMLQDVLRQRRTEIDFINGAIVKEGKKLGIPTPINSVLANLVKTIESSYALQVNKT